MAARHCSKCRESHAPPVGRAYIIPNEMPLPKEEGGKSGDSDGEDKVAALKNQLLTEQRRIATTGEIFQLEKELAELRLQHNELQTQHQELMDKLPPTILVHDKVGIATGGTLGHSHKTATVPSNVSHALHALHGFSKPGESPDTGGESDSDDSTDSKLSNRSKRKSVVKKREKLFRLSQFTASRKRPKSFEECMSASMDLATKLMDKGHDIRGYLDHLWFVSEQASLGRFRPECILAYDQGVRDKTALRGMDVFACGEGENFYRFLGSHEEGNKNQNRPNKSLSGVQIKEF